MKPPCMVIVGYILPSIRAMIAKSLIEEHGLKPIEVAARMEITPAAITQYVKGIRGKQQLEGIEKSEKAKKAIEELTLELSKKQVDTITVLDKICKACRIIRNEGLACKLHKEELPGLKDYECKVCITG